MFKSKLEFKGAIIGTLLGDACIPSKGKEKYLTVTHRSADREYLEEKAKLLGYLNKVKVTEGISRLNGKEYPYVNARTLSHPFYTHLHEHMYHDGRKTVDEHVLKCLSPLGLALWYLDDGTLAGEQGWRNPYICSHHFNKVENELLCRMVHKNFGVTFRTIRKHANDKNYYWMRLRRKDRDKFFDIIRPYVPLCMMRKIDPEVYVSDEQYFTTKEAPCAKCGAIVCSNVLSSAKNCAKCNEEGFRSAHSEYYRKKANDRKSMCVQCGKEFIRKSGRQTTHCSKACSGKTRSEMWKNTRGDQAKV